MNAQLLNPFAQPIPDSVSATLGNAEAILCRFNRGRTLFSGQYLAVGQLDGPITIWDVETRSILRTLEGHIRPVSSISWSACNRYLASASSDWNVIVWDLAARGDFGAQPTAGPSKLSRETDQQVQEGPDHACRGERKRTIRFDTPVASAEFAPDDSRKLLVVLETQEALILDLRQKVRVRRRRKVRRTEAKEQGDPPQRHDAVQHHRTANGASTPHQDEIEEVLYEHSFSSASRTRLWTPAPGEEGAAGSKVDVLGITAAKFSPHSDRIFAGTSKGAILVFDANTAELLAEHKVLGTNSGVKELAFDRSGRHLVVNTNDRAVRILNVVSSAVRPDGAAIPSDDEGASKAKRRKVEAELVLLHKYQDLVNRTPWNGIGFSGDSDYVVGGAAHKAAHNVYIWDRSVGTLVKILEGPKDSLVDVDWHPERPMLASVSNTGAIYIWFTATEEIWSAYAPGFEELEENVEYAEREDEFDLEDEEELTRRKQDEEEAQVNILGLGPAGSYVRALCATRTDPTQPGGTTPDERDLVPGTDSGWQCYQPTVEATDGVPNQAAVQIDGVGAEPDKEDGPDSASVSSEWVWQERSGVYYVADDDVDESFVIPPDLE